MLRRKGALRVVISLDLIMRSMAVEINSADLEPGSQLVHSARVSAPSRELPT